MRTSLKRQTFRDFEWIISSPTTLSIPEATCIQDPPKDTQYWPLNGVYNNLLKHSTGDIVVSYQDWIQIPPDALERISYFFDTHEKSCVSGVGDIYKSLSPDIKAWSDPRKTGTGELHECRMIDIEFNFCAIPMSGFKEIGGCDEYLDTVGYDPVNPNVCDRLDMLGYRFYLDQALEVKGIKHGEHPEDWDKNFTIFTGEYEKRRQVYIEKKAKLWYIT